MDGMSDLQMLSDSSESSGQSGSPSQSQASGMQVSSSRQWNSPTSHTMASRMAWQQSGEEERGNAAWGDDSELEGHMFQLNMSVSGRKAASLGLSLEPDAVNWFHEVELTEAKFFLLYHHKR